jgi:hypothetical protein
VTARAAILLTAGVVASCNGEGAKCPSPGPSVESLGDGWIGGFVGDGGSYLRVDFAADVARLHPNASRAPLAIIRPSLSAQGDATFTVDDGKHRRTFRLRRRAADALEGAVVDEKGVSSSARLVRVASDERSAVDAVLGGTFAVGGDPRRLVYAEHGRLFDTRDGTERRLFLLAGRRALVGAGAGTAFPPLGVASLDGADVLRIERQGAASITATRVAIRREEIRFASGDVMLQGTLLAPATAGPHPCVVFVHGSGRSTRKDPWENAMARFFLARGIAMFLYDKRGAGDSGGEYVGPGARDPMNVSEENLARLTGDARAAMSVMASRACASSRSSRRAPHRSMCNSAISRSSAAGTRACRSPPPISGRTSTRRVQVSTRRRPSPRSRCRACGSTEASTC